MVIGSYTGDGAATKTITLGFQPKFGVVFTSDDGVGRILWGAEQYQGNTGFLSRLGCTLGLALTTTGFTAKYSSVGGADGFTIRFNYSGAKYIYAVWK